MTSDMPSPTHTSFYLHSSKNLRLYPREKYSLTHLLFDSSITERFAKNPIHLKRFSYTSLLLAVLLAICTIMFQMHIYAYNSLFGPFHLNLQDFTQHLQNFENGPSWFKRIEYIQIELGENNIQTPLTSGDTIRRFSDPFTRRHLIATYKKVRSPSLYVKLPTRSRPHFHARLPFRFASFSIRTLWCVAKALQDQTDRTYEPWYEKSEYVQYIESEYAKNATQFNMLVISKCGLLIGYLYRPLFEKAFKPTHEHPFSKTDVAFDATRQYYPVYVLVLIGVILLFLSLKAALHLSIYLPNVIRLNLSYKCGLFAFPLVLPAEVMEELWLLNNGASPHEQMLALDVFIQRSRHRFAQQVFIIENDSKQLFVVFLKEKLHEQSILATDSSPFTICPVTDIRKILLFQGICYGEDCSWIPWPWKESDTFDTNYAEWLHDELMEMSAYYKQQYEDRVQCENENQLQQRRGTNYTGVFQPSIPCNGIPYRQRRALRLVSETPMQKLVREEENHQRLKRERQHFYERLIDSSVPASPQFIAELRLKQEAEKSIVDDASEKENTKCMICLEDFKLGESFEEWPCPSLVPHRFHYDCMLAWLRRKNTCPICRHPVQAYCTMDDNLLRMFFQI